VGKVAARWQRKDQNGPEELEFKISRIDLLSEVRSKLGKFLNISIHQAFVTDELVDLLDKELQPSPAGSAQVRMKIVTENDAFNLSSGTKTKIAITDETLEFLKSIPNIEFYISEN